jgi:hypothetical protein
MTRVAGAARWTAIAIAIAAVIDPSMPIPQRSRPSVRVLTDAASGAAAGLSNALQRAGFAVSSTEPAAATILVSDHVPAALLDQHSGPSTEHPAPRTEHPAPRTEHPARSTELWALDTTPRAPNVRIASARGPAVRLPGQAADVRVTIDARGVAGKTSELTLEDAGIAVASARHTWKGAVERWQASLQYLPPGVAGGRLRVKVAAIQGETSVDDNAADVGVPPMRGPIRTLVVEAGVTWPALFARRAIEGEPAFAVAALQRATTRIATRAGAPPAALTRASLVPFEVALVGAPDNLSAADVDTLRWFVEERGGVVVLIPDRRPIGRYLDLIGAPALEPRALEAPVSLTGALMASELLVAPRLPAGARAFSATATGEPVIFSARRGLGAVIFSGALDAWRYRARGEGDADGFARFWRRAIAEEAAAVPPLLEVSIDSPIAAIGEPARVRARLRATELAPAAESFALDAVSARAVSPGAHVDEAVRLWPSAEPGVYEGEWRPSLAGDYTITVNAGPHAGDVPLTVASSTSRLSPADPDGLALAARASGGRVFPADRSAELIEEMKKAFPARTSTRSSNPMRSPWWVVPFAGLLCAEWALRRRRGLG